MDFPGGEPSIRTVVLAPRAGGQTLLAAAVGPVDVVLDGVYGLPLEAALQVCAPRARLALTWLWAALAADDLQVETRTFSLEELPRARQTQAASPHAKCVALPNEHLTARPTTSRA